jgi:hypothetical protein
MTVKDLIKELQTLDGELEVLVAGPDYDDVGFPQEFDTPRLLSDIVEYEEKDLFVEENGSIFEISADNIIEGENSVQEFKALVFYPIKTESHMWD